MLSKKITLSKESVICGRFAAHNNYEVLLCRTKGQQWEYIYILDDVIEQDLEHPL